MPKLLAYHPAVGVRGEDGEVSILRCSLPDYEPGDVVLRILGGSFGVATAGDLVHAVKDFEYANHNRTCTLERLNNDDDRVASQRLEAAGCRDLRLETEVRKSSAGSPRSDVPPGVEVVDWDYRID